MSDNVLAKIHALNAFQEASLEYYAATGEEPLQRVSLAALQATKAVVEYFMDHGGEVK